MAEASRGLDRKPEALRAEVAETRARLADKLEIMEQGIKATWQSATAAVSDTVESAKATVETTVREVQGAVQSTNAALGWAFDYPAHVRRHPWLMVGGALLLGLAVGSWLGRPRR
jgi:ElaB/YqjD/DUF883 family membrane-anchored ribosome-binding protein